MGESHENLLKAIRHYQECLDKYTENRNDSKLLHCLERLYKLPIKVVHLEQTGVGRTVNGLRKLGGDVGDSAKSLVAKWKDMVVGEQEEEEDDEDDEDEDDEEEDGYQSGEDQEPSNDSERDDEQDENVKSDTSSSHRKSDSNRTEDRDKLKKSKHSSKSDNNHGDSSKYLKKDKHKHHKHNGHTSSNSNKHKTHKRKIEDSSSEDDSKQQKRQKKDVSSDDEVSENSHHKQRQKIETDSEEESRLKERKHKTDEDKKRHKSEHKSKKSSRDSSSDMEDSHKSNKPKEKQKESGAKDKHKSSRKEYDKKAKDKDKKSSSKSKEIHKDSMKIKEKNDDKKVKSSKNKSSSGSLTTNGIDSGSGASFAEALGMCEPSSSKNSSKKKSIPPEKKEKSVSKVEDPVPKLLKEPTLDPIDLNISSLLPTITPNYRPLGNYINTESQLKKNLTEYEALSNIITSKNQRTKVYSGNKMGTGKVPSLFELCIRILQDNIDALEYTGGVPYSVLKPILEKSNPNQLFTMEHHNPYLIEDTDELWQLHCQKEFRNKKREELESWREMYLRCLDEREAKLRALTANIKQAQDKSLPVRTTKLAYVDAVAKPPRNIARKQAKNGTAFERKPSMTPAARLSSLATSGEAGKVAVPNPGARAVERSSSQVVKQKKAPLMMKSITSFKNRFKR